MLEIESKFRVDDAEDYAAKIRARFGVEFGPETREDDLFFRCESLGFPEEGKSLRVRRRGEYLAVTFKGPKLDSATKTREEIELPLALDGRNVEDARETWIRFLTKLGFVPAASVAKSRRRAAVVYAGRSFEITLDRLDGVGVFTELETIAEEVEFERARETTLEFARSLGLENPIVASYLALALEAAIGTAPDEK